MDKAIEIHKEINKIQSQIIEYISMDNPKKWETIARKVLAGDISVLTGEHSEQVMDLCRKIKRLEEESGNPYYQLINMGNKEQAQKDPSLLVRE